MVAESSAESSSSGACTVTVWGVFQLAGVKSNSTAARVPSPGSSNMIGDMPTVMPLLPSTPTTSSTLEVGWAVRATV